VAVVFLVLAAVAGMALPVQAGINAQLAHWVGGPIRASAISFAVGTAALIAASLVATRGEHVRNLGDAPWWVWIGGVFGAFYVASLVAAAPRVGAVAVFAAVIAGQLACSLVLDHFGLVGYEEHHVSLGRVAGVACLAAGVALVRLF
jgi:bacterial/archaeal transporter family-2 protein